MSPNDISQNIFLRHKSGLIEVVQMLQTPAPRNQFNLKMYSTKFIKQTEMNGKKIQVLKNTYV